MLAALLGGPALWYANRATGLVLVVLLTTSTALGVLSTARAGSRRWPRFATQSLHRNASVLAVLMLAVHIATAVVDTYVDIRWYDAVLPFGGRYAPWWLGLGSVASDLMLCIVATSLIRRRLDGRRWRRVHLLAYPMWAVGLLHGLGIGTDTTTAWAGSVNVLSVAVVGVVGLVRLATLAHERRLEA